MLVTLASACVVLLAGPTTHPTPASAPAGPIDPSAVQVRSDGVVDLHLRETPITSILRLLSVQTKRNISASRSVTGNVSADMFGVTFEEALEGLLQPSGFAWEQRGRFIYVATPDELRDMRQAEREQTTRVFVLNHVDAEEMKTLIEPLKSETGKIAITSKAKAGIEIDRESFRTAEDTGGNSRAIGECIVVKDFPENIEAIARLIQTLDVAPKQVLVEAVILRVRLAETNSLGVDFNTLAGIDFRQAGATTVGGQNMIIPETTYARDLSTVGTDFAGDVPEGGMTFGLITNHVAVFIRALEETSDVSILANPKVLALNNQRGQVIVGRRDGYITTTVTETTATETVEFLETGTQIVFRPFITGNGYVRMEIHPEDSSGGLNDDNLPFEETTEVTSNILVKDGHTIVIGGLFREASEASKNQIPVLGNIPVAGPLFRGSSDVTAREEMIILITPHIVAGRPDDEVIAGDASVAERLRVGVRRGLHESGRERLAQQYYRRAATELRAGKAGKALCDVDMALRLCPSLLEAIRLKEQITRQRFTEADGSAIRNLIQRRLRPSTTRPGAAPTDPRGVTGGQR